MREPSNPSLLAPLARKTGSRIVFIVMDGLGGVIGDEPTALQRSTHPHLDALAAESALGRCLHVADGITPGSGPGHFALFGYDPLDLEIGRGLLEALGLGVDVGSEDVAIRGNLCHIDADGNVTDRRAGRVATEDAAPIFKQLQGGIADLEGVDVEIHPGLQYRFAAVLRGNDLHGLVGNVDDTDPQVEGKPILAAHARDAASGHAARVADALGARAQEILAGGEIANAVLLRGISGRPPIMTYPEMTRLTSCCIAAYPAYRGVARMLGMDIKWDVASTASIADEVDVLEQAWGEDYDFFFLHVKATDSAGEDGDEERKAKVIEAFDEQLPRIRALEPDVIVVCGDHSTPGPMAGHSWHASPFLLQGPWSEADGGTSFDEVACDAGRFGGRFPAMGLIRLAMANAGKLAKFGA